VVEVVDNGFDHPALHIIGEPPCIELVLIGAVVGAV
jgi:hypothetical protein